MDDKRLDRLEEKIEHIAIELEASKKLLELEEVIGAMDDLVRQLKAIEYQCSQEVVTVYTKA